jgi:hypothetical protein
VHIFNAEDDNSISEEDFNAYHLGQGPVFTINLPSDNFVSRMMGYGIAISDAYAVYWFMAAMYALAVAADKKIFFSLSMDKIYTNLYIYILGDSTLARKTTAVKKLWELLVAVFGERIENARVPNEFSPEAFVEHMDEFNHAPWIRDEAAGVLSMMKKEYMRTFKDTLMQLYDCTKITRMLRTSQRKADKTRFNVSDPYLNAFFASTGAALGANTDIIDTMSGFMARFNFAYPQGEKETYMPLRKGTAVHSELEEICIKQLKGIAAQMDKVVGCEDMSMCPEGADYFERWCETREKEMAALKDGYSSQIMGRLLPTALKYAMLFELGQPGFDPKRPIRAEFVYEACRLMDSYFLQTTRTVYDIVGTNADKAVIDRVVEFLKLHDGRATKNQIMKTLKIKSKELNEYISTMLECHMVRIEIYHAKGKGRDTQWLFLENDINEFKISEVSKISKISKISQIPFTPETSPIESPAILDTLATLDILPIVATEEEDTPLTSGPHPRKDEPTPSKPKEKHGLAKFKAGMKKRTCLQCGEHFSYDLGIHYHGGYICAKCHREGPPNVAIEPQKADAQVKLSEVA